MLTPVTAAAAVVMIAFALTMNVRTSDLLGELQDENASLRDQLDSNHATISANFSVVSDSSDKALTNIQELRDASYVMAMAANQSLLLEPLTDGSRHKGSCLPPPKVTARCSWYPTCAERQTRPTTCGCSGMVSAIGPVP